MLVSRVGARVRALSQLPEDGTSSGNGDKVLPSGARHSGRALQFDYLFLF